MPAKRKREKEPEEEGELKNKMLRLPPEAIEAFDVLKARQGSRSGPRLAAEAIDLLLQRYGEKPVGPLRPGAAGKPPEKKPKP